jgi:hypothetical protein
MVLVHDGFVESGFMDPEPSGRRVIPHYLTPGTFFALAHIDGRAIGATSVIPDGPWGLPSAHAFADEVAAAAELGPPVEVGSLVVSAEHRSRTRPVFMHQMAGIIRVLHGYPEEPVVFGTVAPEQERFYAALFGLRRVGPVRDLYGAPAVSLIGPIGDVVEHVFAGHTMGRRTIAGLLSDPGPVWLRNRLAERDSGPVPAPGDAVGSGAGAARARGAGPGLLSGAP